jgi:hypothetical protein
MQNIQKLAYNKYSNHIPWCKKPSKCNSRIFCKQQHFNNTLEPSSSKELFEKLKIVVKEANNAHGDEDLIRIWEKVKYYSNAYKVARSNEEALKNQSIKQ